MNDRVARIPRFALPLHALLYALGNLGLAAGWLLSTGFPLGYEPIPYWPAPVHITWGVGLALHAWTTRAARRAIEVATA